MKCIKIVVIFVLIQIGSVFTSKAIAFNIGYVYQDYKASDRFPSRLLFVFRNNQAVTVKYNNQAQFILIDFIPCNNYWSSVIYIESSIEFTVSHFILQISDTQFILFDYFKLNKFFFQECGMDKTSIHPTAEYLLSFDEAGNNNSYAYYFDLSKSGILITERSSLIEYFSDTRYPEQVLIKDNGFKTPISFFLSSKKTMIFSNLKQQLKYYKRLK